MSRMGFAMSTYVYYVQRLAPRHLDEIARRGFKAIELFALREHFDYHDPTAGAGLASWLGASGLTLHAIHAPIADTISTLERGPRFSIGTIDQAMRAHAVTEISIALGLASQVRPEFLVVHLGNTGPSAADDRPDLILRSLEEIQRQTSAAGVRLALEVIPNKRSSVEALVRLIEEDLDTDDAGICLDFGHAHLMGDLLDAIESASGHLITTHVHDNRGASDDHLVPFDGSIDWPSALMALRKIGYDGRLVLELEGGAEPGAVLDRAARARDGLLRLVA